MKYMNAQQKEKDITGGTVSVPWIFTNDYQISILEGARGEKNKCNCGSERIPVHVMEI
jgi:hypothetical protein